jgi:hypothetical protein
MEQKIYDAKTFPLQNVDLGKPFHKNGMYFIKMYVSGSPIYIQPPKCSLKQGVLKSGKKLFCDLVFSIEDNYFLTWLEKIEEIARTRIFENRTNWFETELDEHDIEQSLVSPYKMYKSGKCFVIRTNIPTTLDKCDLKIYDENENEIAHEDLKEDTNVITIIELKGIKCSARNFQFIFDVRQMLVIKPVKIFEKCIIKTTASPVAYSENDPSESVSRVSKTPKVPDGLSNILSTTNSTISRGESPPRKNDNSLEDDVSHTEPALNLGKPSSAINSFKEGSVSNSRESDSPILDEPKELFTNVPPAESNRNVSIDTPKHPNTSTNQPTVSEICEVEFDLAEISNSDTVQIKPRNDVYYRMYKAAKQKAKEAKLVALSSYLEAKRIKTTYSLVDSSDDSSNDEDDTSLNKTENDSDSEF